MINKNFVQTEIAIKREAVVRRRQNKMRVRPGLAVGVHAGASVLDFCHRFTEAAVGMDGQRGDAAAAVIRDEQTFAGGVHGYMAWAAAAGKLLVQWREPAGF